MKQNEIREQERFELPNVPQSTKGGFLEIKEGELCLRMGDMINMLDAKTGVLQRSWQRPGREPFDAKFYALGGIITN
ncbi:MAG: hypothetical protein E6R03_16525 [Hyphomicrobiaceae bacterium]|nr:MAG: hypothetical protein E6R03_16525 [Hyphomicrobiaceae bacterium]